MGNIWFAWEFACEKFHKLLKFMAVAKDDRAIGSAAQYAGLGIQFAVSLVVFAYAGLWLDRRLGTSPLFVIVGVFLGAGGAFYSMIRRILGDTARRGKE